MYFIPILYKIIFGFIFWLEVIILLDDLKISIDKLSGTLNSMLSKGIEEDNYDNVLEVSQELDKLILLYTKLTTKVLAID